MRAALFIDRDGTINKLNGYIKRPEDLHVMKQAKKAIQLAKDFGFRVIVITNQPGIAQGRITVEQMELLNAHLAMELDFNIDMVYYCPHHPERGWPGELPELKIQCDCRKPLPGMILKAAADNHIDLAYSWMIGDSECDMVAGEQAGCNVMRVMKGRNLLQCVNLIIKEIENARRIRR